MRSHRAAQSIHAKVPSEHDEQAPNSSCHFCVTTKLRRSMHDRTDLLMAKSTTSCWQIRRGVSEEVDPVSVHSSRCPCHRASPPRQIELRKSSFTAARTTSLSSRRSADRCLRRSGSCVSAIIAMALSARSDLRQIELRKPVRCCREDYLLVVAEIRRHVFQQVRALLHSDHRDVLVTTHRLRNERKLRQPFKKLLQWNHGAGPEAPPLRSGPNWTCRILSLSGASRGPSVRFKDGLWGVLTLACDPYRRCREAALGPLTPVWAAASGALRNIPRALWLAGSANLALWGLFEPQSYSFGGSWTLTLASGASPAR